MCFVVNQGEKFQYLKKLEQMPILSYFSYTKQTLAFYGNFSQSD